MHQNYPKHAALILLFVFVNPSFAMGRVIFKASRIIGMATVPICGLYLFNEEHEKTRECDELKKPFISETAIQEWGRAKMTQLNVPDAKSISFIYGGGWATSQEKFVIVPRSDRRRLNKALKLKDTSSFDRLFYKIRFFGDDPKKVIARHSMILKHEIGHIINKDSQNSVYNLVTIPVAVEAVSFGITSAFRKLYNIQTPKTFAKGVLRSCSALGAVVPKALVGSFAYAVSNRYHEVRADTFACKNAESRLELEEFEMLFQKRINKNARRKNIEERDVEWLMFFYSLLGRFDHIPIRFRKQYIDCFEKGLVGIARQLNDPSVSEQRKRILRGIFQVINDPSHPSEEKRAANIRKYIKKWDKEHPGDEKRA